MSTEQRIAKQKPDAPLLEEEGQKFIQRVFVFFLGRAADNTLLYPVSAIAFQSAGLTEDTLEQTLELLNYIT